MTINKDLQQVAQGIEASSKTSATPPGQTDTGRAAPSSDYVEAINQVFALFRLNYHNQYYAAFPDNTQVNQIKKLWLEALGHLPVEQILRGAKHAIENSEYLPTLNRMLECCQQDLHNYGLVDAHQAYQEACNASSPKSAHNWSHSAVYFAGRDSGWFLLANNPEHISWPIFRDHYQDYCARVMRGEKIEIEATAVLEKHDPAPLSTEQQLENLKQLKKELNL